MPFLIAILARLGLSQGLSRALGYLIPIGLAAACVGFLWLRGSHYEHQRDKARAQVAELTATLDRIKKAQAAAAVAAKQAKLAQEALYNQLAEKADEKLEAARRDAMAAAERYIALHRVRSQAAGGSASHSATPAEDRSASGSNRAGSAPIRDEVTVSADDIRICTTNTSRLEAVHDWAIGLNQVSIAPQSLLPLGER